MSSYKRIVPKKPRNDQRQEWSEFKSLPKELQEVKDKLQQKGNQA